MTDGDVDRLETEVRALLASDLVTAPTRAALSQRLEPCAPSGALDGRRLATLAAAADDLLPLGALGGRLQVALRFDAVLAEGVGDGWRYADAPPDLPAVVAGLDALDAAASPATFGDLPDDARRALLSRAQAGGLEGAPPHWFEELLAGLARVAYAHPLVQRSLGYDGMADAHGFQDVDAAAR